MYDEFDGPDGRYVETTMRYEETYSVTSTSGNTGRIDTSSQRSLEDSRSNDSDGGGQPAVAGPVAAFFVAFYTLVRLFK